MEARRTLEFLWRMRLEVLRLFICTCDVINTGSSRVVPCSYWAYLGVKYNNFFVKVVRKRGLVFMRLIFLGVLLR
jgi:hypothetical protein